MARDVELVRDRLSGVREATTHRALDDPFDDALDDDLADLGSRGGLAGEGDVGERLGDERLLLRSVGDRGFGGRDDLDDGGLGRRIVLLVLLVALVALRRERLAELAAVAIEGVRLEAELPAEPVARADLLDRRLGRQVDRLRDRTRDEGLRRRHHADVALGLDEPLAGRAATVRAVEDREVRVLQVGGALDRLRAADRLIERLDLRPRQAERLQAVEREVVARGGRVDAERREDMLGHRPRAEREGDLEDRGQAVLDLVELLVREALAEQEVAEGRSLAGGHRSVGRGHRDIEAETTHHVGDDVVRLVGRVAERLERRPQRLVGDLEVAATRELLELDEREVGLDARRVAVHEEADRAGGRDDGGLRVSVAELLAVVDRIVPGGGRAGEHLVGVREVHPAARDDVVVDRDGTDAQRLVLVALAREAHRGAAVIAHHAQHVLTVLGVAGERPVLGREQRALGVRTPGEDRGEHAADRATLLAVVGDAGLHEHGAEIRVAETERAVAPREVGDLLRGERRHQHRHLEHDRPKADRVLVALEIEGARLGVVELEQVDRREVARRVVEEHVLGARVAGVDAPARGAGVPRVDRAVVLDARVGAPPRGEVDLVPEFPRLHRLRDLAVGAAEERPLRVGVERVEERVGDAHRVVRVLAADRVVGLAVEVVVELEVELLRERLLLVGELLEALDEGGDLDLLARLPGDELLDVGVIEVEADHLRRAARGAARLDRACGAVTDLEETHEARALAAARERLVLAAELREVRARSRAVLEEPRLAQPEVHDAALADEVVAHRLDEAGVRLRVAVGVGRALGRAGAVVGDPVALRRAGDAVGVVEAGVEPLRAVRRRHLVEQHVRELVVERLGVALRREVAVLLAPVGPAAREAVDDLAHRALGAEDGLARLVEERRTVGGELRDAGLAEVLAHDDVRRQLAPRRRDLRVLHLEDGRAVGVADAARTPRPLDGVVDVLAGLGESSGDLHECVLS